MNSDFTSKDTSLWSSGICTVLIMSIKSLVDCTLCRDSLSPLQLALDCTETAITNSTHELPLPKDDIMDLLKLCLTCSFFQYNDKHYEQLHGTAMGSPVSGVGAEIVMQNIEQQALATNKETLPLW